MPKKILAQLLIFADYLSEKSGFQRLMGAFVARMRVKARALSWVPSQFVPSVAIDLGVLKSLVIHLHVYHDSYIQKAKKIISDFPDAGAIVVTSPFESVIAQFRSDSKSSNVELHLIKNVGRNFGALKQIVPSIYPFRYLLHLHSKESKHMSSRRSAEWSRFYWDVLASRDNVVRILGAMDSNDEITISYPELTTVLPSSSYQWGSNKKLAESLFADSKIDLLDGQIAFPAGGMFICQSRIILDLLGRLGLEDFPKEPFPLDGSIAHALERLLGVYALEGRPVHLVLTSQGLLTTDLSFKSFKGVWG